MNELLIMRHPLICYFALAYGISWLVWAPLWLPALGVRGLTVLPFHHALGALGPIAAPSSSPRSRPAAPGCAICCAGWACGADGRLVADRAAWAARAAPAGAAASGCVRGARPVAGEPRRSTEFPQFSALGFLAYNVVSFGFGEEVGWRRFALPRLQEGQPARRGAVSRRG